MKKHWILVTAIFLAVLGLVLHIVVGDMFNFGSLGSMSYFSAGNFSAGVFSAGIFSIGIFSIGIFSIGIFSLSIFNIALYGIGIFLLARHEKGVRVVAE